MDRRTLIAIVLSLLIILGYQFLMAKFYPQKPVEQKPAVTAKEADKEETQTSAGKETKPPVVPQPVAVPPVPSASKPLQTADGQEIKIETELYSAGLSSTGGTVKRWELKKFKDKDGISVVLQGGKPVVPALSIGFDDKFAFADIKYKVSGKDLNLDSNTKTGTIVFQYTAPTYSIKRTYTFYHDSYRFDLKDEVTGLQEYWITVGSDFGINNTDEGQHVGPVLLKDADRIELSSKKLKETQSYRGGLKWIAQEDKYFFAALVPLNPVEEAKAWTAAPGGDKDRDGIIAFRGRPDVNSFLVYAGPKDAELLKPLNVGLEHIIDFGFFAIIAKPLFWLLKLFYKILGNYGWAIVLIAIVTRLPFIPLLNKSQESMKKMQEIQPKVNEIKEKYKKDPQRMQKEMMDLYKKHKVNPIGGCLPLLIQLPIFIALYKVLSVAIELRGAPFIFWITDLSVKDPYYVLPVVMGASWLLQQKMMPTPGDPRQAKIMMFMPVIFTFMFLGLASGLVLYWLIGNVLSIIQQFFVNKKMAAQETHHDI